MTTKGGRAKAKGKAGERNAKALLKKNGYMIASTEIQGLAGDDIFALDELTDRWFSIEVKNTNCFNAPKMIGQAKAQALSRETKIQDILSQGGKEAELLQFLGVDSFKAKNWLVLWHPTNCGCRADSWVAAYEDNGKTVITDFASL